MPVKDQETRLKLIRDYHQLTKHRPGGYAPGPGGLDWANQPDPFRRFQGAPITALPLLANGLEPSFDDLHQPDAIPPAPLDRDTVAMLFQLSFGLSTWKSWQGNRWALRCNPSSGNLHPIEAYLACPGLPGLEGGIHHYLSLEHGLEQRSAITDERWQSAFHGNLLVGLSYIPWREAWKYGTRAFRYCQLDMGHAVAALRYAAATLGWGVRVLTTPADTDIAKLLGLDRKQDFEGAEAEIPGLLLAIGPDTEQLDIGILLDPPQQASWQGQASRLSESEMPWLPITEVIKACRKSQTLPPTPPALKALPAPHPSPSNIKASDLIRHRRSAQAFDGETTLTRDACLRLLDSLLPRSGLPPWDSLPWAPKIHPILFVHRVKGLEPGLYILPRDPEVVPKLATQMRQDLLWQQIENCPEHLHLYLLEKGDCQHRAQQISCFQDIAADGALSLGMLAEFSAINEAPHWYRYLYWEAGILGQALYLGAEAIGLRGTGIGCFFDDDMHQLLGLQGEDWQILYHFTLGGAVDDPRLETFPAYAHLDNR